MDINDRILPAYQTQRWLPSPNRAQSCCLDLVQCHFWHNIHTMPGEYCRLMWRLAAHMWRYISERALGASTGERTDRDR